MTRLEVGTGLPTIMGDLVADVPTKARFLEELGFDSLGVADVIVGDGTPALEPVTVLAFAAAVTWRIRLSFGVLVLPLRPVAWVAAQVATLQHLSGGRIDLGVGSGGFPGSPFWRAVGVPTKDRGARTDAALEALPGLIAGEPTRVGDEVLTLAPPAPVPPFSVGGNSEVAMRRAVRYGGWLPSLLTPEGLSRKMVRLREIADELDRPVPKVSVGGHAMLVEDAAVREAFVRSLVDLHGATPDEAAELLVSGAPAKVAETLIAYADAGADAVGLGFDGGQWERQAELFAEARSLVD